MINIKQKKLSFGILLSALIFALSSCSQVAPNRNLQSEKQALPEQPLQSVKPVEYLANWAIERHKQKLIDANAQPVDLLMLGDSITHAWEGIGKASWDKYYKDRNAFNLGIGGDRTENVLWRIGDGAFDSLNPKLTVLLIGTNNTGHRMDPVNHTVLGIKAIISEINQRMPESKILLLAIFPRQLSAYNEMRIRNHEINTQIAKLADNKKIYFLDINHKFLQENGDLKVDLMPDELHPNEEGYRIWSEAMEPIINKLLQ